jgi:hypothetical protein
LEKATDQLWNSLYWTPDETRPDRLAAAINTIIQKNSTAINSFIYDRQAVKNVHKFNLTREDMNRIEKRDRSLAIHAQTKSSTNFHRDQAEMSRTVGMSEVFEIGSHDDESDNNRSEEQQSEEDQNMPHSIYHPKEDNNHSNVLNIMSRNHMEYILSRIEVDRYLKDLSNHIHLNDDSIRPKSIDVRLINMTILRGPRKLFSYTAFVRARNNVSDLPLRCPSKENRTINMINQSHELDEKVEKLTNMIQELTNQSSELKSKVQQLTVIVERLTNHSSEYNRKQNELTQPNTTLGQNALGRKVNGKTYSRLRVRVFH